jgi:hypothetical protein
MDQVNKLDGNSTFCCDEQIDYCIQKVKLISIHKSNVVNTVNKQVSFHNASVFDKSTNRSTEKYMKDDD